jgi:hypothetical protein
VPSQVATIVKNTDNLNDIPVFAPPIDYEMSRIADHPKLGLGAFAAETQVIDRNVWSEFRPLLKAWTPGIVRNVDCFRRIL